MSSSIGLMLFSLAGGSTLQWGMGRGLLFLASCVTIIMMHVLVDN